MESISQSYGSPGKLQALILGDTRKYHQKLAFAGLPVLLGFGSLLTAYYSRNHKSLFYSTLASATLLIAGGCVYARKTARFYAAREKVLYDVKSEADLQFLNIVRALILEEIPEATKVEKLDRYFRVEFAAKLPEINSSSRGSISYLLKSLQRQTDASLKPQIDELIILVENPPLNWRNFLNSTAPISPSVLPQFSEEVVSEVLAAALKDEKGAFELLSKLADCQRDIIAQAKEHQIPSFSYNRPFQTCGSANAYFALGRCLLQQRKGLLAESYFKKAVSLTEFIAVKDILALEKPDWIEDPAVFNEFKSSLLSSILKEGCKHFYETRCYAIAATWIDAAKDSFSTVDTFIRAGDVYQAIGRLDDAVAMYERAFAKDPKSVSKYVYFLINYYHTTNKLDDFKRIAAPYLENFTGEMDDSRDLRLKDLYDSLNKK
jgi:tetratricopeptide (TPR) repeat protein